METTTPIRCAIAIPNTLMKMLKPHIQKLPANTLQMLENKELVAILQKIDVDLVDFVNEYCTHLAYTDEDYPTLEGASKLTAKAQRLYDDVMWLFHVDTVPFLAEIKKKLSRKDSEAQKNDTTPSNEPNTTSDDAVSKA